eukprot:GHVR01165360.1.p1 GENE.GHVR01165360.1~~GHVR01165360.1.p1  ORF type:complete len:198 (+),score=43.08 GHVR01165360.1:37-630(+)
MSAKKKIVKCARSGPITGVENDVAKALMDIEANNTTSTDMDLKDIYISSAKEITVSDSRSAIVVYFPYKVWKNVTKIQGRLVRELEKKFNKKHVILVAQRTMVAEGQAALKSKGMRVRPKSRTLTAVHDALLEDVVGPTDIIGKRVRCRVDGSKILKILLDPKADKDNLSEKFPTFAAVYNKLTNKSVVFMFPEHVY